jgi:hypothetical protein
MYPSPSNDPVLEEALNIALDYLEYTEQLGCSDDEPVGNEQFNITPKDITHKPTDAGLRRIRVNHLQEQCIWDSWAAGFQTGMSTGRKTSRRSCPLERVCRENVVLFK